MSVVLPGLLRDLTGGEKTLTFDSPQPTVRGALDQLHRSWPAVYERLMTESGEVRPHVNLFLGKTEIRYLDGLNTPVSEGDEIVVLPSVSGG